MPEVKKEKLGDCPCGEPWVIVAKIRPGSWIAACRSCPTHVYAETEAAVRKKWNEEVASGGCTGKRN